MNFNERITEIRSAADRGEYRHAAALTLATHGTDRFADVLRYARGVSSRILDPDMLAQDAIWWRVDGNGSHAKDGLWWIDKDAWRLSVLSVEIATQDTLDLQPLQHAWSTTPARHVLPVWEEWAREHAPEHLNAPRRAIEAKEAWCRGEATNDELRAAGDAAWA
ncbi:MAG: hypothetical protein CL489_07035, partial [Acidobacteria bacterium]|nr:hypothetical protein [Acidobacteriota bacterium]